MDHDFFQHFLNYIFYFIFNGKGWKYKGTLCGWTFIISGKVSQEMHELGDSTISSKWNFLDFMCGRFSKINVFL
jgi:hypothetical protein